MGENIVKLVASDEGLKIFDQNGTLIDENYIIKHYATTVFNILYLHEFKDGDFISRVSYGTVEISVAENCLVKENKAVEKVLEKPKKETNEKNETPKVVDRFIRKILIRLQIQV